jgi:hypothetical protein
MHPLTGYSRFVGNGGQSGTITVSRVLGFGLVPLLALGLVAGAIAAVPDNDAGAAPNNFVTMPDGVQIAVTVRLPDHYQKGHTYPTRFEMSGNDSWRHARGSTDTYVTVHASARGTGSSGGEFDRFNSKRAMDAKFIVNQFIVLQPWSNGDVTIRNGS